MVHCGSIRQTASITEMSAECLRTGDKARVKFRFVKHPEYLQVRFLLNMLKFLLVIIYLVHCYSINIRICANRRAND